MTSTNATSEVEDSVTETMSLTSGNKPRLSLANVALGRKFAKRMSTFKRLGTVGSISGPPLMEREPTYQLEPIKRFSCAPVEKAIKETMDGKLQDAVYDAKKCSLWIKTMSEDIKYKVKLLGFDRHKIVVVMTLCQRTNQDAVCTSRCQWDPKFDNHVTYTFANLHLMCNATVFGVYRE
ncbi:dynein light chain Tctex-type 5-A-like [Mya arenaria]|uniref:dynein light chain Tctex-type 5-A-like n=1 Tax=Mya arenaria TaxID=6604 RepID=UPI0022E05B69|nr:dynein light chain Tctex-type 5-A-like [Mya arenaria]